MSGTPLILGEEQREALRTIRDIAVCRPVDIVGLGDRLKLPKLKAAHMQQMTEQTVVLLFGWTVTFSIETGHPIGVARHMSMSSPVMGRMPIPEAVWMVATELGFVGEKFEGCTVWTEDLIGHGGGRSALDTGRAINVVQPINLMPTVAT